MTTSQCARSRVWWGLMQGPIHGQSSSTSRTRTISTRHSTASHTTRWVHFSDVTWVSYRLKLPRTRMFIQKLVQCNGDEVIQVLLLLALYSGNSPTTGGFPAQRKIQKCGTYDYVMTWLFGGNGWLASEVIYCVKSIMGFMIILKNRTVAEMQQSKSWTLYLINHDGEIWRLIYEFKAR